MLYYKMWPYSYKRGLSNAKSNNMNLVIDVALRLNCTLFVWMWQNLSYKLFLCGCSGLVVGCKL
jgi:hypothetical protein